MNPKYVLIPLTSVPVLDTPRSKTDGAIKRRDAYIGFPLQAYDVFRFDGVPYAWLVPQNPTKPEWVRVAEADGSLEYVKVVEVSPSKDTEIVSLLKEILFVLRQMWKSS